MVRFPSERSSGNLLIVEMTSFLNWIKRHTIVDLHLGGAKFAWSNHWFPPILCVDRFLVS